MLGADSQRYEEPPAQPSAGLCFAADSSHAPVSSNALSPAKSPHVHWLRSSDPVLGQKEGKTIVRCPQSAALAKPATTRLVDRLDGASTQGFS